MIIHQDVIVRAAIGERLVSAVIDTGASISMIPSNIASEIGTWRTDRFTILRSAFQETKQFELRVAEVSFPSLANRGGRILFALDDEGNDLIIGMNVLEPMGIWIDTQNHRLEIRNEGWEAFKKVVATGAILFVIAELLSPNEE